MFQKNFRFLDIAVVTCKFMTLIIIVSVLKEFKSYTTDKRGFSVRFTRAMFTYNLIY